jgi:hypothetical protein
MEKIQKAVFKHNNFLENLYFFCQKSGGVTAQSSSIFSGNFVASQFVYTDFQANLRNNFQHPMQHLPETHLLFTFFSKKKRNGSKKTLSTDLPIKVFPVPGGPNNKIPFGALRSPTNISGFNRGNTTASMIIRFAYSKPAILSQSIFEKKKYNLPDLQFSIIIYIHSSTKYNPHKFTVFANFYFCILYLFSMFIGVVISW